MLQNIAQIAERMKTREVSSEELVKQSLEAIKSHDRQVNAFSEIYEETALAAARKCDHEADNGNFQGRLHGIPFAVKDLFLTKGLKTARGSSALKDFVPNESAPIVERCEAAGAIIIGKTTTTEMGWSGSSVSEFYGHTRNPWNTNLTSGGSSSGSGAALAAGFVPCALGSDGGGSVRIPAAFCGVFAMKGSLGRIPAYPWSATEMLSHAGPMTRSVIDSQIMFDVLKGPDPRDHLALPNDGHTYEGATVDVSSLRIAFAPSLFGYQVDTGVAAVIASAVEGISKEFDTDITMVDPSWSDPIEIFETLWVAGRGVVNGGLASDTSGFGAGFRNLVEQSKKYSLPDYINAMKYRAQFSNSIHSFFEDFDILLLPTVPNEPFDAALEAPEGMVGKSETLPWTAWTPFTYPFNISGNPAASIPCGLTSNSLPVGLQVIGRRYEDSKVLAFCRELEKTFSWTEEISPLAKGIYKDAAHQTAH